MSEVTEIHSLKNVLIETNRLLRQQTRIQLHQANSLSNLVILTSLIIPTKQQEAFMKDISILEKPIESLKDIISEHKV